MNLPIVFISYARDHDFDRDMSRRMAQLLRRPVADLATVFLDEVSIRPNDVIDDEIQEAIDQTAAAVLLVSPSFIDSDYVNDIELPAIYGRHHEDLCQIWPLNVRRSVISRHPFLDGHLLSPDLDHPLHGRSKHEQETLLAELAEAIITFLDEPSSTPDTPDGAGQDPPPSGAPPDVPPAAPLATDGDPSDPNGGHRRGMLGVPELRDDYVKRDAAVDRIWADLDRHPTAGISGQPGIGLAGEGGVGKTVLAAAVCHDPRATAAFPGGICWVTAGQGARPVNVQSQLVRMLGHKPEFTTALEGRDVLDRLLDDRAAPMLIVVDDVWSADLVDAVPAPTHGRRIITTRNAERVLAPAGVAAQTVGALSLAEARELTARRMATPVDQLPVGVDELIRATGGNSLLVRTMASALAMGANPTDLLERIRVDGENPHPYLTVFRVLRSATAQLGPAVRQRYLRLAVFPPDIDLPRSTVDTWWRHLDQISPAAVRADLVELDVRDLLTFDQPADVIRFHDHQHDFVSYELDDPPRLLHGELLDAFNPDGRPWAETIIENPYLADHLVGHLEAAGHDLTRVVLDADYLAHRIVSFGPYAALQDLDHLRREGASVAGLIRHIAHLLTGLPDVAATAQTIAAWTELPSRFPVLRPHPGWPVRRNEHLLATLTGHTDSVWGVAWSPDGTHLATTSRDGTVRIWDPTTGTTITTLTGHTASVWGVAWSPDGTHLATSSHDHTVRIWDPTTGTTITTLTGHTDWVWGVAWSPDGTHLATTSDDRTVRIWDPTTGTTITTLALLEPVRAVDWHHDVIAVGHGNEVGVLVVVDAPPG
ncbi:MAG: NB-ARC domain-containing protein [Acidimicrobiales bacterium]